MARDLVLGVDFGTSYTSAGAFVDGRVELVVDNGDPMIPSVVHVPARGPLVVGHAAVGHLAAHPGTTVASIKRLLGSDLSEAGAIRRLAPTLPYRITAGAGGRALLQLGSHAFAAEQIAAAIFDRVRSLAEQRFGASIRRAVVTASAVAPPGYVEALRRAARLAHLEIVEVLAEPIAGALAVGMHGRPASRRLLVCDFGGGTFDVTTMNQAGLRFQSIATGGDPFLGGDDLDEAMVQELAGLVFRRARFDLLRDVVRRQVLAQRCESAKRALSSASEARMNMRDAYIEDGAGRDINIVLERTWAERLWDPLFARALTAVDDTLNRSRWSDTDVDEVVLIGGTSLVPRFQAWVSQRFEHVEVTSTDIANVAVAMGATLLTARHGPGGAAVPVLEPMSA